MMIIIFWEMVLIRATRRHLPEDDNHQARSCVLVYFKAVSSIRPETLRKSMRIFVRLAGNQAEIRNDAPWIQGRV
jgi:hypothetical protein